MYTSLLLLFDWRSTLPPPKFNQPDIASMSSISVIFKECRDLGRWIDKIGNVKGGAGVRKKGGEWVEKVRKLWEGYGGKWEFPEEPPRPPTPYRLTGEIEEIQEDSASDSDHEFRVEGVSGVGGW
ncbi:hypothetical protein TrLO_g6926 [Triparma laevis f. longispina]|uniref:Uncharacterized protein n=1 Tax=Triparma laevis f. longispina TaxID=1714387 RepID=A0A9W7C3K5_9STRA|nr:hypothetical protein TrLO_g6926 [Triparma laevis f. longispina]